MRLFRKKNISEINSEVIKKYNRIRRSDRRGKICYAPYKSLTFFLGGKVMACWHNKQFLLGSIPEDTIDEIWNGTRIKILRKAIMDSNLDYGCYECKKQIINRNFSAAGAPRYDYLPEGNSDYPVSMDFQIDDTCNNECIMCNGEYSSTVRTCREKKDRYPNPYGNEFINQLLPYSHYLKEASFSGGEVFLSELYFAIWDRFIEINPEIRISVTTNGTFLNDKVKYYLEKLNFNINISIDTLDADLFAKIRRNSKLEPVLDALNYFNDYTKTKKTELIVRICIMQQNWRSVPDLISFLNEKSIKFHINQVIFPPYSTLINCSYLTLKEVKNLYSGIFIRKNNIVQKTNSNVWTDFLHTLDKWMLIAKTREETLCEKNDLFQMKANVIEKVSNYIKSLVFINDDEKRNMIEFIKTSLTKSEEEISDAGVMMSAYEFYLTIPVNRLVDEFNIRAVDKIVEFTRQAGIKTIEI